MSLKVKNKKGPALPPIDGGTYPAVCVGVIDLGEQYNEKFKKYEDKVLFIWEFPSVMIEVDGEQKPRWLSKDFSATLNEKSNLAKFLVSWRGKNFTEEELNGDGFNLKQMLGESCLLQVIVEEKDSNRYNRITGCMGFPMGMPAPVTGSDLLWFDMDEWDDDAITKFPDWVQLRIRKSTQYQKYHVPVTDVTVEPSQSAKPTALPGGEPWPSQSACAADSSPRGRATGGAPF